MRFWHLPRATVRSVCGTPKAVSNAKVYAFIKVTCIPLVGMRMVSCRQRRLEADADTRIHRSKKRSGEGEPPITNANDVAGRHVGRQLENLGLVAPTPDGPRNGGELDVLAVAVHLSNEIYPWKPDTWNQNIDSRHFPQNMRSEHVRSFQRGRLWPTHT